MKKSVMPRTTRPSSVPKSAWDKMGPIQRYNLSNGLLVYDKKTKRCKRSALSIHTVKSKPKSKLKKKVKVQIGKKKPITWTPNDKSPLEMVSGHGSFEFSDQSTYVGEMKNQTFHGSGTRTWKDSSTYTGEWKKGLRHGHGKMIYASGVEYNGEWKDDLRSGRGTMFRRNGSMFVADWKDNLVVKPYTEKSIHELSADYYKLYMKLGTFQKVADKVEIDKDEVHRLVRQYIKSRKSDPVLDPKRNKKGKAPTRKEFINFSQIEKLHLVPRTIQILKKNGIITFRDLTRTSKQDLLKIKGLGNWACNEIESSLKRFGLRLAPNEKERVVDIRNLSLKERRALRKPSSKKMRKINRRTKYLADVYGDDLK